MRRVLAVAMLVAAACRCDPVLADDRRDAILAAFAAQAKAVDPSFARFSADRGKAFWFSDHTGGRPETGSCTVCHTKLVTATGQTRAGKEIAPMAVSKTPDRFTDPDKVAKWFLRNCQTVLGRECTPVEKGDIITFLAGQ